MKEISSRQDFENAIQNCVVVEFYADWCGPCKQLEPRLNEANADVAKLNVDSFPGIAQEYGVRSVPTLMAFNNGEAIKNVVGSVPKNKIENLYQACT